MLFVIRHGERCDVSDIETEANRVKKRHDTPITLRGQAQARATGVKLKELCGDRQDITIMTSPFLRCAETAYRIAEVFDDKPIQINYALWEYLNRYWYQKNPLRDLVIHEWDFPVVPNYPKPSFPETYSVMQQRFTDNLKRLFNEYVKQDKILIVVTHAFGPQVLIENVCCEDAPFVEYCSITKVIKAEENNISLELEADYSHVEHLL